MQLGPNMKRLREMDVANGLIARVVAGPGDLLTWEVDASLHSDGMPLEVTGRGTDLEAAAAAAMLVLSENGSMLLAPADGTSSIPATGSIRATPGLGNRAPAPGVNPPPLDNQAPAAAATRSGGEPRELARA